MAGHSKWANIQHRKGAQDKKRGKLFSKLNREIMVAAKLGDPDPASNPRLRLAIDKARAQSMPKDNIERAIKKGSGQMDSSNFEEVTYEGYGPGGVAVMVRCLTDNRNRTVAEVRHAFYQVRRQSGCRRLGGLPVQPGWPDQFSGRARTKIRSWKRPWRRVPKMSSAMTMAPLMSSVRTERIFPACAMR